MIQPLKLYLLRHGETALNAQNIVQGGGIDEPLNDTGFHQRDLFFQKYKDVPFNAVYTSTLIRTIQTVEPFIKIGIPHFSLAELKEISWGKLEGSPHIGETARMMIDANDKWMQGETNYKLPGGESADEALARIKRAFDLIISKHDSGNILICTHGRLIRIQLAFLLGYGLQRMTLFKHQNTSLNIIVKAGNHFFAEKLNDLSHLQP
jgi:probable phosphoglycerate mutase